MQKAPSSAAHRAAFEACGSWCDHGLRGPVYFIIVKAYPFCLKRIQRYAQKSVWIGTVEQVNPNDSLMEKWAFTTDNPHAAEYFMQRDSVIVAFWREPG